MAKKKKKITSKEKAKACGISMTTFYLWRKRKDWPGDNASLEILVEYSGTIKQPGHNGKQGNPAFNLGKKKPDEDGSLYAKKERLAVRKLELENIKLLQQTKDGRRKIGEEIIIEIHEEVRQVLGEVIDYIKESNTYDGKTLKELFTAGKERVSERIAEIQEAQE